jgi:hypothetical protein
MFRPKLGHIQALNQLKKHPIDLYYIILFLYISKTFYDYQKTTCIVFLMMVFEVG